MTVCDLLKKKEHCIVFQASVMQKTEIDEEINRIVGWKKTGSLALPWSLVSKMTVF